MNFWLQATVATGLLEPTGLKDHESKAGPSARNVWYCWHPSDLGILVAAGATSWLKGIREVCFHVQ